MKDPIALAILEGLQARARSGEDRAHLIATAEVALRLFGVTPQLAARLIPRASSSTIGEERDDCKNPIRGEGGRFAGCAPGEGGEEASGPRASSGKRARLAAEPAKDLRAASAKERTIKAQIAKTEKKIAAKKKAGAAAEKRAAAAEKRLAAAKAKKETARAKREAAAKRVAEIKAKLLAVKEAKKQRAVEAKAKRAAAAEARAKAKEEAKAKREAARAEKAKAAEAKKAARQKTKATKGKTIAEDLGVPPPEMPSVTTQQNEKAAAMKLAEVDRGQWDAHVAKQEASRRPIDGTEKVERGMSLSREEFESRRVDFSKQLSKDEVGASLFYTGSGYKTLNGALRAGQIDEDHNADLRKVRDSLDSAIAKHTVPEDTYVSRGVSGEYAEAFLRKAKAGAVFEDSGYTSTSATKPFFGDIKMRIKLPKGAKAAPVPSSIVDENEYLLPRNSRFRVVSIQDRGAGAADVELELVQ
jgi:hypothetical protein